MAREEIVNAYTRANTILNLACGNLGTALARSLFANGDILRSGNQIVKPFYQDRVEHALACCQRELAGLPYRVHKPEGAIFLWLWFEGLPISSQQLYQQLKDQGLLVVPGEPFFVGLSDDEKQQWPHHQECIRVSYAQSPDTVEEGFRLIGNTIRRLLTE